MNLSKVNLNKVLNSLKGQNITLNENIIHSETGVSHLSKCSGKLLNFSEGETWEPISALARMTDSYGNEEPIWLNPKDIKEVCEAFGVKEFQITF